MDPLTGIAASVDRQRVLAQLLNRAPELLEDDPPNHALFIENVRGVASEVIPVIGTDDPPAGPVRDMAVWCITLGVAAHLEAALFPEQQLGEDGRAEYLRRRYLGVLADLRRQTGRIAPMGAFPPAPPEWWPEPAPGVRPGPYIPGDGYRW
jgi:hypothetical protein